MIRTLILSFIFCTFISNAFAVPSTTTPDGIRLEVENTSLIRSNGAKYATVTFVLTNESDTKKVDLDQGLDYALSDEFGNRYRTLPRPANYKDTVEQTPPGFPSVYPGESCARVVFFETPVEKAVRLKLQIKTSIEGLPGPLEVEFPAPRPDPQGPSVIEITSPENGMVITAGNIFLLNVKVNADDLPFKMIIVAFGKTLEDSGPSKDNSYNITVPPDTQQGPASISVIGYWTDPHNGTQKVLSENIVIAVNPGPRASP